MGIEAVPYKGPVLAACMYGNLALRQFVDLDIIVRRRDVFRASDVLQSVGYRPNFPLTRAQEAGYLRSRYAVELERDDGYFAVELHWEVAPRYFAFPLDTERLWARLDQVSMYDTTVRTLAPEDLLLMLCAHGAKHLWEKLGWICDIAELVRTHRGMDWDRVAAQARELRSERILGLGLLLASDLLGADVPSRPWAEHAPIRSCGRSGSRCVTSFTRPLVLPTVTSRSASSTSGCESASETSCGTASGSSPHPIRPSGPFCVCRGLFLRLPPGSSATSAATARPGFAEKALLTATVPPGDRLYDVRLFRSYVVTLIKLSGGEVLVAALLDERAQSDRGIRAAPTPATTGAGWRHYLGT